MVKRNKYSFATIFSEIFNNIIKTGIYPSCLKIAKVVPVLKTGNSKLLNNYRPISTLSVFDKILEKLIYARIVDFLNKSNFFCSYQFGFRKGIGSDLALTEISNLIYKGFDNQNYVGGIFLDLQKAFDNIDHELLLLKLYDYGIRGVAYKLLSSFLQHREQFVMNKRCKSNTFRITYGVPQGSVLGPLLFLIFINDIAKLPLSGQIRMFADDTAIFYVRKNQEEMLNDMKSDLNILIQFFNSNLISLNLTKSKFIIFRSPFKTFSDVPSLNVFGFSIERVKQIKYLGLTFDEHMNWQDHIDAVCNKISPLVYLIRKLNYIPIYVLRDIYFSFIHSRINYGISVYGTAAPTRLKKLQVFQNKSCKAVYKLPYLFGTKVLYKDKAQGILPINALFELQVSVIMYKSLHLPVFSNIQYNYVNHTYETRHAHFLNSIRITTEYGRKSIEFVGPHIYNNLPETIKKSNNVYKFKKDLKSYLGSFVECFFE